MISTSPRLSVRDCAVMRAASSRIASLQSSVAAGVRRSVKASRPPCGGTRWGSFGPGGTAAPPSSPVIVTRQVTSSRTASSYRPNVPLDNGSSKSGSSRAAAQPEQPEQQQQQQQPQAPLKQLRLHRISGDGACMFRALVQGAQVRSRGCLMPLSSEASAAHNLRLAVVEDLRARRAELEPFVAGIAEDGPGGAAGGFGDFDAYLAHMSRRGVWGGEPELLSASTLLRAPVTVFHVQQGMLEPIVTYGEGLPGPAINVLWTGMHYDLLLEDGGGRAPGGGGGGSGGNPNDNAAAARSKGEAPRSKL